MQASPIPFPDSSVFNGAVLLTGLGIVGATGPDAAAFLHGQLSQDMNGLSSTEARPAAYCSAKGRMLASFVAMRPEADTFWLLADAGVLPAVVKRLSMFVLRSKVKVADAGADMALVGLLGAAAEQALGESVPAQAWGVVPHPSSSGWVLRLPDVQGVTRCLWVGPRSQAEQVAAAVEAIQESAWNWLDVMSGVARIEAATVEQFVPQMINFELVGGVNFKKGCYPGQEVVARSQYRGTLKRRAFLLHGPAPMQAGQEVFSENDPTQPAGMVANAAPVPVTVEGAAPHYSALVELKLQALDAPWHLGSADGPLLSLGTLPYEIPSGDAAG